MVVRVGKRLLQLRNIAQNIVGWNDGVASWNFLGNKYKVVVVWREIRPKMEKVGWHRLVWAAFIVPKHALVT